MSRGIYSVGFPTSRCRKRYISSQSRNWTRIFRARVRNQNQNHPHEEKAPREGQSGIPVPGEGAEFWLEEEPPDIGILIPPPPLVPGLPGLSPDPPP